MTQRGACHSLASGGGCGLRWRIGHLIEAVELPDEPVVGVQWRPEVLWHTCAHAMGLLRGSAAEGIRTREVDPIGANTTRTDR
jgi:hypothetical protein